MGFNSGFKGLKTSEHKQKACNKLCKKQYSETSKCPNLWCNGTWRFNFSFWRQVLVRDSSANLIKTSWNWVTVYVQRRHAFQQHTKTSHVGSYNAIKVSFCSKQALRVVQVSNWIQMLGVSANCTSSYLVVLLFY